MIEEVIPTDNYDVVIIGGGPGGYAAALYGASAGLNIAMIERSKVGGSCLHVGCIPTKELLETGALYRNITDAADFGIGTSAPTLDMALAQTRKQKVVDQLHAGLSTLLKRRKITVLDGTGTLHADHVVRVTGGSSGEVELRGEHVILATGSVPRTIPGFVAPSRRSKEISRTTDSSIVTTPTNRPPSTDCLRAKAHSSPALSGWSIVSRCSAAGRMRSDFSKPCWPRHRLSGCSLKNTTPTRNA